VILINLSIGFLLLFDDFCTVLFTWFDKTLVVLKGFIVEVKELITDNQEVVESL